VSLLGEKIEVSREEFEAEVARLRELTERYSRKWPRLRQLVRNVSRWETRIADLTRTLNELKRRLPASWREYRYIRDVELPWARERLAYWTSQREAYIAEMRTELNEILAERERIARKIVKPPPPIPVIGVLDSVTGLKILLLNREREGSKVWLYDEERDEYKQPVETIRVEYTACYDEETEILTRKGWKKFKDLSYEDELTTLNPETFCVEYHRPIRIIKQKYKGKMYRVKSRQIDLLVTPEHKMFVKTKAGWRLIPAYQLKGKCVEYLKTIPKWKGEDRELFELPSMVYTQRNKLTGRVNQHTLPPLRFKMDDWLEFLGYYLSEGSLKAPNKNGGGGYCIVLSQNPGWKREKMKRCIKRLGFNVIESGHNLIFVSKQVYFYLKKLGKAHQKYIPEEFKELSRRQLRILIRAMLLGDGSKLGKHSWSYRTVSEKLRDDFQEIVLKAGFGSTIWKPRKQTSYMRGRVIRSRFPVWDISVTTKRTTPTIYEKHGCGKEGFVDYDGMVYCVEVPNHIILVRRNGRPVWSGNSVETGGHESFIGELTGWTIIDSEELSDIGDIVDELIDKTEDWFYRKFAPPPEGEALFGGPIPKEAIKPDFTIQEHEHGAKYEDGIQEYEMTLTGEITKKMIMKKGVGFYANPNETWPKWRQAKVYVEYAHEDETLGVAHSPMEEIIDP
jgi:hypothetical protein